jgi:serine phosphatase RsbU (regulator of sigma subunit)
MAKELLKQEFQIGQDIQKSILRSSLKEAGDFVFSTSFTPAKEVSGDFYDVYKISENKILICVADTAGKGISACLYSLGARSMLRALAKSGISLEKIIKEMNELFLDDAENQGAFITAFIGLLNLETCQLTYASCGHPSAYLLTNQRVEQLQGEGMALGADLDLVYAIHYLDMKQGDKILIYTDGVIEAQNQDSEMYTPSRLNRFLESQKVHTAAVCVHDLSSDVMAFTDKAELHDDVTILCFEKRK